MTVIAQVLYPKTSTSTFDMKYYLATHMPLVYEKWSPHGLKSYIITDLGDHPADGSSPPYMVCATLMWENSEGIKSGIEKEGKTVFGDIPNFTNVQPVFVAGNMVDERK